MKFGRVPHGLSRPLLFSVIGYSGPLPREERDGLLIGVPSGVD